MTDFDALKIMGFDFIEFAVADLDKALELYLKMGFEKAGTREILERKLKSYRIVQNDINIILSQSDDPKDPVAKFHQAHGDGIMAVAFRCEDAVSALEITAARGAEVVEAPRSYQKDFGSVTQSSIKAFGDVRHTFISREGNLFAEGFDVPYKISSRGYGLMGIDHVTNNVAKGDLGIWVEYYEKIFGLSSTRFFDIHTQRTGLYSKVMESPNGIIKMPINEPTEEASQIQEFLNVNHGAGVQHLALTTNNIVETLTGLKKEGLKFLEVPRTYYEEIPKRVPNIIEDLSQLADLGILVDGSRKGYLLQIFTHNLVGPFFYEVIQRRGDNGFGEGNFTALFEAIERDQIQRGVLKEH